MECFRLLFNHLTWIKHQFLSGIRDSRKAGSLWGMMRGLGGVRKSEHQSWLAKKKYHGLCIYRDSKCRVWCQCRNCTHNYSRGTEDAEDLRKVCPKDAQRRLKKDVVMTAGRWLSWSIQIPQFLMLLWPAMKAGSTAMTQRPRDRVPSGSMLALPDPRRPDRANPHTNIWWSFFLTVLAWSTCTGFPLDRQSTRNTMFRF